MARPDAESRATRRCRPGPLGLGFKQPAAFLGPGKGKMSGEVSIFNVGTGDTKLVFDKNNPQEVIRAGRIVKDMIRRGYSLLIEIEDPVTGQKICRRALDFDENVAEYIIADFDPIAAQEADKGQESNHEETEQAAAAAPEGAIPDSAKLPRAKRTRRIKATETRAFAVGRTAGG